jgi:hypothetical protein
MTHVPNEILGDLNKAWAGNPVFPFCVQILEAMAAVPEDELEMITYTSFMNLLGKAKIDSELIAAIGILSNAPVRAIEEEFLFSDDEDEEHFVPKSEIDDARSSGTFVHPEKGSIVTDFEQKITPVFRVSDRFKTLKKAANSLVQP